MGQKYSPAAAGIGEIAGGTFSPPFTPDVADPVAIPAPEELGLDTGEAGAIPIRPMAARGGVAAAK
jgi:hypothetical protein